MNREQTEEESKSSGPTVRDLVDDAVGPKDVSGGVHLGTGSLREQRYDDDYLTSVGMSNSKKTRGAQTEGSPKIDEDEVLSDLREPAGGDGVLKANIERGSCVGVIHHTSNP